jgi:hypothetical protein
MESTLHRKVQACFLSIFRIGKGRSVAGAEAPGCAVPAPNARAGSSHPATGALAADEGPGLEDSASSPTAHAHPHAGGRGDGLWAAGAGCGRRHGLRGAPAVRLGCGLRRSQAAARAMGPQLADVRGTIFKSPL